MKNINVVPIVLGTENAAWNSVDISTTTNQNTAALVGTTINGTLVTATTRVLLTGQTTQTQNGIYVNNERAPDYYYGMKPYGVLISDITGLQFWAPVCQKTDILGLNNITYTVIINTITNIGQTPIAEAHYKGSYSLYMQFSNNFYQLTPSTVFTSSPANYWTHNSGRLTWNGPAATVKLNFSLSANLSGSALLSLFIYINNTALANFGSTNYFRNGSDTCAIHFSKILTLTTGQTVSIYSSSSSGNRTIYVSQFTLMLEAPKIN
jgi:hypothetical protein